MQRFGYLAQRFLFIAMISFMALAAVPSGASANNSEAAKACQQDGYLDWTDADGNPFRNAGACASYVARGGTIVPVHVGPSPYIEITDISYTDLAHGHYCGWLFTFYHFPAGTYYWESTGGYYTHGQNITLPSTSSSGYQLRTLLFSGNGNTYTVTVSVYSSSDRTELIATDTLLLRC